jgi:Asp-tRNA(Asn)/Glu-tRNA(Gln) amidotransferase B subunit
MATGRHFAVMRNVLLLAPYPPGTAPSQRFRFEQYLEPLAEIGYRVELRSLLRGEEYARLYERAGAPAKAAANWIIGFAPTLDAQRLAELIRLVVEGAINREQGVQVLGVAQSGARRPRDIVRELGLAQATGGRANMKVASGMLRDRLIQ